MAIPPATHKLVADYWATQGAWVSLHTGAGGGTTGANEATGGSYARKQTTWGAGTTADPSVVTGSEVNIPCAAGTYTEGGIWTLVTAGVFRQSIAFSGGNVVVSGTGASIDVTPSLSI